VANQTGAVCGPAGASAVASSRSQTCRYGRGAERGQALAGEPASVGISYWASASGMVPGRAGRSPRSLAAATRGEGVAKG
jgi:hypothetical protein